MNKLLYIILSLLIISCKSDAQSNKKLDKSKKEADAIVKLTGKQIIDGLDRRHFFDLTDTADLTETKKEFEDSYNRLHFFEGKMKDETLNFTDNRFYIIDCEELFEIGGLTEYLDVVKVSFEKLHLKLSYSDEKSAQTEKHWNHTINLNGKQYVAYNDDFGDLDWGIAFINFIEMLNDQLYRQGSNEQFYPISSGNDGKMVLLTPEQFQFVQINFPKDENLPKTLIDWRASNKL